MTEDVDPYESRIKAVVVILAILIVISLAIVIGTIAYRAGLIFQQDDGAPQMVTSPSVSNGSGQIAVPAGSEIVDMTASGQRVYFRLRLADGGAALLTADPLTGERLALVPIVAGQGVGADSSNAQP